VQIEIFSLIWVFGRYLADLNRTLYCLEASNKQKKASSKENKRNTNYGLEKPQEEVAATWRGGRMG